MGVTDPFKRWRRSVDFHSISIGEKCKRLCLTPPTRRVIFLLCIIGILFIVFGPVPIMYDSEPVTIEEKLDKCISDYVNQYYSKKTEKDFFFYKDEAWSEETFSKNNKYSPMVGNGVFSVSFTPKPTLYLRETRTLSLNTLFNPVQPIYTGDPVRHVFLTDILKGKVDHFICMKNGLHITLSYIAHRTQPNLFYQDVFISNPTDHDLTVNFGKISFPKWISLQIHNKKSDGFLSEEPLTFTGLIKNVSLHESVAACISIKGISEPVVVPAHRTKHYSFHAIIHSEIINTNSDGFHNSRKAQLLQQKCRDLMRDTSKTGSLKWEQDHFSAWDKLWKTGLSISQSKAVGAINTDHINATVYFVISNVLLNKTENNLGFTRQTNLTNYLPLVEGCYGGYHHTLQAINLWRELSTYETIISCVNLWLLTLEKQGCHKLLMTGAEGTVQAMILSFGGFRFSPHHLELKIEPKFLHRDYKFRNIKMDTNTFINVSIILQDNNKAILAVSMKESDKDYWACDGGCIDEPVKISSKESIFPVKITEPSTSILYITPDKSHMELIKDTLHVHKIVEAPAHDTQVVALHKHGSHLGGVPTFFWVTVVALIVIFHLFLCRLIYNECGKQDRSRGRYARLPGTRGLVN